MWAVLGVALLLAVPVVAAPRPVSSNRFLFVVDTSASMKPFEAPLREALFDLIYSGARGRMTNNDTYGIWMVNEKNDTSFPMETWRLKQNVELAATAVTAVKEHGLKGKALLDIAMADLAQVIKNVDYVTVVLVSNGETPIHGTRFDDAINARLRELAPEMKRAKATLNLALVAQDGEYVAWAVNSPEFLLEIPFVAHKPKPVKVEVTVEKPASSASNAVRIAAAPVVIQRIASSPIIITRESVAQERRSYVSAATIPDATPALVVSNLVPAVAVVAVTNAHVAIATNVQTAIAPTIALPPATNLPVAKTAVAAAKVERASTKVVEISELAIPAVSSPASPTTSGARSILWWALTGGSVTLACVFGVMLLFRGRRRETSLISQSLMRERIKLS